MFISYFSEARGFAVILEKIVSKKRLSPLFASRTGR